MRRGKIFGESNVDNHDAINDSYRHVILSAAREYNRYHAQRANDNAISVRR